MQNHSVSDAIHHKHTYVKWKLLLSNGNKVSESEPHQNSNIFLSFNCTNIPESQLYFIASYKKCIKTITSLKWRPSLRIRKPYKKEHRYIQVTCNSSLKKESKSLIRKPLQLTIHSFCSKYLFRTETKSQIKKIIASISSFYR